MATIRQIAQDPHKALMDLEKELGAEPGDLLKDMERLGPDNGWAEHLPYRVAASYYDDDRARAHYEAHVDDCEYCKVLLNTLHPADPQVRDFARTAAAARSARTPSHRSISPYWLLLAAAASVAVTVLAVPQLQRQGVLPSSDRDKQLVVHVLNADPTTLAKLQTSNDPAERYLAARYYFTIEQPQLAYRQIGEGLELSGLPADYARAITTAADVPSANSAETIEIAVQRLSNLQTTANENSADYLETAQFQAKLGFHDEALKSIRQSLKARNTDPRIVSEFSATALAKSSKVVTVGN